MRLTRAGESSGELPAAYALEAGRVHRAAVAAHGAAIMRARAIDDQAAPTRTRASPQLVAKDP